MLRKLTGAGLARTASWFGNFTLCTKKLYLVLVDDIILLASHTETSRWGTKYGTHSDR